MKNLEKHKFIVNVSVIVYKVSQGVPVVLVMKRSMNEDSNPGKYGVPGGKMDGSDTSLEATAAREVHEEIGLRIKNIQYFESHVLMTENGQKLYVTFCAEPEQENFTPILDRNEVESVSWWSKLVVKNVSDELFTKGTQKRILDFF